MQRARHSLCSQLMRTRARAHLAKAAAHTTDPVRYPRQLQMPGCEISFQHHISSAYKICVPLRGISFIPPTLPGPERGYGDAAHFSSSTGRACWSCGTSVTTASPFFCPSCHKIQSSDASVDFFQLLGIPKNFEVDVAELESRYKALQRRLHPDLFALHSKGIGLNVGVVDRILRAETILATKIDLRSTSTSGPSSTSCNSGACGISHCQGTSEFRISSLVQIEQEYSAENSSRVIGAYYTLLHVLPRSNYLLKLAGREIEEQAGVQDMGLLQEIMEAREAIEEANGEEAILREIQKQNEQRMRTCETQLKQAFEEESWSAATELVHRLTYLEKINDELKKAL